MRSKIVQAVTLEHKLEVAVSVLRLLRQDCFEKALLGRLLAIDPDVQDVVVLDVDIDEYGPASVSETVFVALRERCQVSARDILAEPAENNRLVSSARFSPSSGHRQDHALNELMVPR